MQRKRFGIEIGERTNRSGEGFRARAERVRARARGPRLALDLGTENTRLVAADPDEPILEMPSCVAIDVERDVIVAIGEEARCMLGRVPAGISVESPIQGGSIASPALAEMLIRQAISQVAGTRFPSRPRLVVAIPPEASSIQRHALIRAAEAGGAGRVSLIDQSLAAAIGAELPVLAPHASLIVDIGASTTRIAVVALGGVVRAATLNTGGEAFADAVMSQLRREHNLLIGKSSANSLVHSVGSAMPLAESRKATARGRDVARGLPSAVEIKSDELVGPIQNILELVVVAIHGVLEQTPPELSADIAGSGIHLVGGGSRLQGLVPFLERALGLPTLVVDEPELRVVRGCQRYSCDAGLREQLDPRD